MRRTGKHRSTALRSLAADALVAHTPDVLVVLDGAGIIRFCNPATERLTGRSKRQLLGLPAFDLVHPDDRAEVQKAFVEAISGEDTEGTEFRLDAGDGSWREVEVFVSACLDVPGIEGLLVSVRDVTERRRAEITELKRTQDELRSREEHYRSAALHDSLTGLPNRTLFLDRLQLAIERLDRRGGVVAVLFADVDRFKLINDSLGHNAGDRVLVELAHRLREVLRPGDTIARFGGDEFVVLCEDLTGELEAVGLADRLAEVARAPLSTLTHDLFVTLSIGIAHASSSVTPEALLRDADAAMYLAKDQGRARAALFDDTMRTGAVRRLETESALRRAVERDELRVAYQPIVDLDTGRLIGAEALVRWAHPERGMLQPSDFIPVAEETGLIIPVGTWVLQQACRQAKLWAAMPGGGDLVTMVNLSGRQLAQPGVVSMVKQTLRDSRLDPRRLGLEITESVVMDDAESAIGTLGHLASLGVGLSIDDFGTGYSSLSYLKRFPVATLKVDRSFVDGLGRDAEDSAIVAAVMSMASALGLRTVAEGVETTNQVSALLALGCHFAQGFHFGRPAPAEAITAALALVAG